MKIEFYEWDKIKEIDDDWLEHNIVDLDGISILCPRLLASDVAHEICIDFDEDEHISYNYVYGRCVDMIEDIIAEMIMEVDDILHDNNRCIT